MAQQEDGWPLGIQILNRRVSLATSIGLSGSVYSSSLSSSSSSFDIDFKETDWETLGSTRRLSPSSIRENSTDGFETLSPPPPQQQSSQEIKQNKTIKKRKNWLCSLCLKPVFYDEDHNRSTVMTKVVSLGYLLEEERRATASIY